MPRHDELLIAIRQVIRAIDLHSKRLNRDIGMTGPQLLILQAIADRDPITPKQVAAQVNLSQGTVTSILDRLEARGLVRRTRSTTDRRSWLLQVTASGRRLLARAPTPLQDDFVARYNALAPWEQTQILSSVQRLAAMMNADQLEAAPMLELGSLQPPDTGR